MTLISPHDTALGPNVTVVIPAGRGGSQSFWFAKRLFDIGFSLLLLPLVGAVCLALVLLNPARNPGPLFYRQPRMGKDCRAFMAIKFRTMRCGTVRRGPNDPVEKDRITPLGRFLRKTRLDELPQIINVLKGDMSLIGPRPDYFHHARSYLRQIPEYRARHAVRPGISGLAQVELGYIQGISQTRDKALIDLRYIQTASFWLDVQIFWATIRTVLRGGGS